MSKFHILARVLLFFVIAFITKAEENHSDHQHAKAKTYKDEKVHHNEDGHEKREEDHHGESGEDHHDEDEHGKYEEDHHDDDEHGKHEEDHHDEDEHGKHEEDHHDEDEHGKHEVDHHDEDVHKGDTHGDSHGGGKAIGKDKAIVDVDKNKGIKLSEEAVKTLNIKLETINGPNIKITKKTLVTSKNIKGVYIFRNGRYKFFTVKILKEVPSGYIIFIKGVEPADQIVVEGVGLLRVTDVYSTDKSEYGHSH